MTRFLIDKKQLVKSGSLLILFIYIGFLYLDAMTKDLSNNTTLNLKYIIIVICFIISLLIGKGGHNRTDTRLVRIARFFTLIADYYLVILDEFKLGIFFFCLVQITYIIRHSLMENKKYKNLIFLCLTLITAIIISTKISISSFDKKLIILGLIYAALLISSVYSAIRTIKSSRYPKKSALLIATGMSLFFMCDLNVAFFNLVGNVPIVLFNGENIRFYTGFLIWVFYVPSQLMLALSGFSDTMR